MKLTKYNSLRIFAFVGIFSALITRICFSFSSLGRLDSDEAVVLLMAKKIAGGKPVVFFFGQQYGGAQEAYLMSPLVKIFGMQTWIARTIPIAITLLAAIVLMFGFSYVKKKKRLNDPFFWAGILFLNLPASFIWWSTKSSGFYPTVIASGIISFSLAKTILDKDVPQSAKIRYYLKDHKKLSYIALGMSVGYQWWASPQSMLFILPLGLWLLLNSYKEILKNIIMLAIGFAVGSAPWLAINLRNGFKSFDTSNFPSSNYFQRLEKFFNEGTTLLFNLRNWASQNVVSDGVKNLLILLSTAFFICLAFVSIKEILKNRKSTYSLFAIMFLLYPFVASINPNSFYVGEGRYLWFIMPSICVLLLRIPKLFENFAAFAIFLSFIISSSIFVSALAIEADSKFDYVQKPSQYGPVVERIKELDIKYLAGDYWIAYRLVAESNGEIIGSPFDAPSRIETFKSDVENNIDAIVTKDSTLSNTLVKSYLEQEKITFELSSVKGVLIYKLEDLNDTQRKDIVNFPGIAAKVNG